MRLLQPRLLRAHSSQGAASSAVAPSSIVVQPEHPADLRLARKPAALRGSLPAARVQNTRHVPRPADSRADPAVLAHVPASALAPVLADPAPADSVLGPEGSAHPVPHRLRAKHRARSVPVQLVVVADVSNIRRPKKAR